MGSQVHYENHCHGCQMSAMWAKKFIRLWKQILGLQRPGDKRKGGSAGGVQGKLRQHGGSAPLNPIQRNKDERAVRHYLSLRNWRWIHITVPRLRKKKNPIFTVLTIPDICEGRFQTILIRTKAMTMCGEGNVVLEAVKVTLRWLEQIKVWPLNWGMEVLIPTAAFGKEQI